MGFLLRAHHLFAAVSPPPTDHARLSSPPLASPFVILSRLGAVSLSGFCEKKTHSYLQV
jgi:hypothetical protein